MGTSSLALGMALLIALAPLSSCSFDTNDPAPYLAPPNEPGVCGSTETLFPKLLAFVRAGNFAPLKNFVERRLVPSAGNPVPDPSLRSLLSSLVGVVTALGLDQTVATASVAIQTETLEHLKPIIVPALQYTTGELGGVPHYEATEAAAWFLDKQHCDPDNLLLAIELVLNLRSPSHGNRLWLGVVLDELSVLIEDPLLQSFLQSFERNAQTGRPAIVALIGEVMNVLADANFNVGRINTLLQSVVYPVLKPDQRTEISSLVDLIGEATSMQAGILLPLQQAIRCAQISPTQRDQIIAYLYDLVTSKVVGLDSLLRSAKGFLSNREAEDLLTRLGRLIRVIRVDKDSRADLLRILALSLTRPDAQDVIPVFTDLIEADVLEEMFNAVQALLSGCGRPKHATAL